MNSLEFCSRYCVERLGTSSAKWDDLGRRFGDKDLISMWVADMDFKTAECITDALTARIEHGVFGYSYVPDSYYQAFIQWHDRRHGNTIEKEWIRFSNGVVVSLYCIINAFTKPDDAVIILTPVYYPFSHAVNNTGRKLIENELVNTNGIYTVDYGRFEKDIVDNDVKLFILCSPHNPVGRVWSEEELMELLVICKRHNVLVVSDEIHQDISITDKKHIPSAVILGGEYKENLITVTSASKTFNLAGLNTSNIVISSPNLMPKYDAYAKTINQIETNILGIIAAETAYNNGQNWLDGVLHIVRENYEYAKNELSKHAPNIVITPMEGTYLMWLDLRPYVGTEHVKEFIQDKCRLAVDFGEWFGVHSKGFIRLNLATNPEFVKQGIQNIITNINTLPF